ncbi:3',5'-cyclic AMP phosphodiesterase CpdA [Jatrophihabitans sp. GAS493]|uniref:metallophosphoesterase family protein n=1 Tax=Jatrophihabitans sp. GAS493 TaxID=1907575 RepID=UPI000BB73B3B|nr:metallophosphoesterase [Jatrophihabitans sp. GAS493]SOD74526.1 3',5'-cyclic AMP phosphodiesterase CpdA [Jatrophihabitans sp. GAS493]
MAGKLFATSDLHIGYRENLELTLDLRPDSDEDWLLVAGDIAERSDAVEKVLDYLSQRFAKVVWAPGNHELWTTPTDPVQLSGVARYEHLVQSCRELGVLTPEDPYPVWSGPDGAVTIAPLFLLYDYTFRVEGCADKAESLAGAYAAGVVCTDERFLDPQPYDSCEAWCRDRVAYSEARLAECDPLVPIIMVNHWPLVREPTRVLRFPEFAQWCGTELTADWHRRFNTAAVVYGHLHIPRTTYYDGVRFEEVSLGYPREWRARRAGAVLPRQILPVQAQTG